MREKIKLVSTAGTGHYYTTTKNKRLHPEKVEIRKFDPKIRKHVIYKEAKIKKKNPSEDGFFSWQLTNSELPGLREILSQPSRKIM